MLASVTYVRLLASCLSDLAIEGELFVEWEVSVCPHQEPSSATTFAVWPVLEQREGFHLGRLQADLRRIAEGAVARVRKLAREHLRATG